MDDEEEQERAGERDDQAACRSPTELGSGRTEDVSTDEGTDHSDDRVAEQPESAAFHELTSEPAGNDTDHDERNDLHLSK